MSYLNQPPKASELQVNKAANNTQYLPISFLEMEADELFFGLWGMCDFKTTVIGNEVCGIITLWYIHPITGVKIERIGAAATMIRCKSGQPFSADGKIANALEMDYPHLKTDCMRNAFASLGKRFGRDLNRKHEDIFRGVLPSEPTKSIDGGTNDAIRAAVLEIGNPDELDAYYNSLKLAKITVTPEINQIFKNRMNEIS